MLGRWLRTSWGTASACSRESRSKSNLTFLRFKLLGVTGTPPTAFSCRLLLASSFQKTKDWESYGAIVANKDNVAEVIELLRQGQYERTVVLVNRYTTPEKADVGGSIRL
jgi:hypothetical protein